jgi:hypothetical protein
VLGIEHWAATLLEKCSNIVGKMQQNLLPKTGPDMIHDRRARSFLFPPQQDRVD